MIIVVYDPINGLPIPDGWILKYENEIVRYATLGDRGSNYTVSFSTENIILAVRAAIKEKLVPEGSVVIQYFGQKVEVDSDGRIEHWPDGFCDASLILLERLFG